MRKWLRVFETAAVAAAAATVYLATLSRDFSGDSLLLAHDVEAGDWSALFDPHHLFLYPAVWLLHRVCVAVGWSVRALFLQQYVSAVAAGLSVGVLYYFAVEWGLRRRLALAVAAGCALSGSLWLFATEGEAVTVAVLIMVSLVSSALLAPPNDYAGARWRRRRAVASGLATITYASALSTLAVFALPVCRDAELRWRERLRRLVPFAVGGLAALAVLALAIAVQGGGGHAGAAFQWVVGGDKYGRPTWWSVPHAAYAFVRSFALFGGLGVNDSTRVFLRQAGWFERGAFALFYTVAGLLVIAVPFVLWRAGRRHRAPRDRSALLAILLWGGLHAGFALWWVPGDLEFWLPVTLAWWLGVVVLLRPAATGWAAANAAPRFLAARLAAAIALLAVVNARGLILPHGDAEANPRYGLATEMARTVDANDLVIVPRDPALRLYVESFARCRVAARLGEQSAPDDASSRRTFWLATAREEDPVGPGWRRVAEVAGGRLWELTAQRRGSSAR